MGGHHGHGFTFTPIKAVILLLSVLQTAQAFHVGPFLLPKGSNSPSMLSSNAGNRCQAQASLAHRSDKRLGLRPASPFFGRGGQCKNGRLGRIPASALQMMVSPSSVDVTEAKVFEESSGGMFKKVVMEMEV
jgi:hypothetical protein